MKCKKKTRQFIGFINYSTCTAEFHFEQQTGLNKDSE